MRLRFVALLAPLCLVAALTCGKGAERRTAAAPATPQTLKQVERAAAEAFRDRVLTVVAKEFPGEKFETSLDPLILRRGDAELHLANLRSRCEAAGGVDSCGGVIRAHFATLLESLSQPVAATPIGWEQARLRLRPQIAPIEWQAQMSLIAEPFTDDLIVAFVLDAAKNYRFVTAEDRERWGVPVPEIGRLALANLEAASQGVPLSGTGGADRLITSEVGDGYDASRLLLPGFRRYVLRELGGAGYAAIPNRDVLVIWSESASPAFQEAVFKSVEESHRTEPYPLTLRLFRLDREGVRGVAK